MEQLLTTEEIAAQLRVHWQTVLNYIRRGELPALKLGKGYRIKQTDFERFLESRRRVKAAS
jgi:excisionase family DNA binding protein